MLIKLWTLRAGSQLRQVYLQLGTFSIFTSFQREVSLFCKKNKKAKERLKTNVKSRMDSELSKRFSANEETIYYDHYSSFFAPRAIFLGGGERGTGRDVLSFFRWWAIKM